ncbi:12646_t:CDS:1, partial [Ambispora leptoticha]
VQKSWPTTPNNKREIIHKNTTFKTKIQTAKQTGQIKAKLLKRTNLKKKALKLLA